MAHKVSQIDGKQAPFSAEVRGKVKVTSSTAQLEGLLAGKTALRGGAAWQEGKGMGLVAGFSTTQAGRYLRSVTRPCQDLGSCTEKSSK